MSKEDDVNRARELLGKVVRKGVARRILIEYSNEYGEMMNEYLDGIRTLDEIENSAMYLDEKFAKRLVEEL